MKGEIAECVWLPVSLADSRAIMRALTVSYMPLGADEPTIVTAYKLGEDHGRKGFIGVPRQWGVDYAARKGIRLVDSTSTGRRVRLPKKVDLREHQIPFVDELLDIAEDEYDIVAEAATGKGKTTMALAIVQRLQSNAIIVVDQENLMDQWIERARDQFGVKPQDIGIVQGDLCSYKGKTIVIAMVQTLVVREFPPEFYDYFGIAIFDEYHIFGAPTFSRALGMFNSRLRLGVSATDRTDILHKLIDWNLGEADAKLTHQHKKSKVFYVENHSVYSWYANTSPKAGRFLQEISEDADRNWLLARIVQWLYNTGRDVLVISERIEQLEAIRSLCAFSGVPDEDMGVYTGYRLVWGFEKDPKPKSRPQDWEKGTEYTPVRYALVRKRVPKKTLAEIKETAGILFATYGMFAKGVDVPRLAAGLDCTPRSKAKQVHGRILRETGGKMTPIWVTVRDINSHRAEFQLANRLDDYVADNSEIFQWDMDRGVRQRDAQALRDEILLNVSFLKTCRYITTIDGHGTIQTPSTRTR